ncbi:AAA family ATPase [Gemella morbillorum]
MNKLFMMIGIPASGKTSLAEQIAKSEDAEIVSSDNIRKELYGDENIQGDSNEVFKIVENRIIDGLKNNKNMIFDATNINYKRRMAFLQKIKKIKIGKIAIMVATPYEQCLIRNSQRKRQVPEEVMKRMYFNFYVPQYFEGWDDIQIKYTNNYMFFFGDLEDIAQNNPHHKLTVLEHCKKTEEILNKQNGQLSIPINFAGRLHDIGKLKTKTFINSKGEKTNIAHFYNHEKVSAYDSLFYVNLRSRIEMMKDEEFALETIKLIQWHMLPWTEMSEKTEQKYKRLLSENFWNDLMILHKADEEAH